MEEIQFDLTSDTAVQPGQKLQATSVNLTVPASLHFLPVLCAALREYCAALPVLLQSSEVGDQEARTHARLRFGTGPLRLPDEGATIRTSYSHLVYSLELALQEAATNIVRHGYGGDNLAKKILLRLNVVTLTSLLQAYPDARHAFIIELLDAGQTFDTAKAAYRSPDPTQLHESGYGLYLIHKLTDQLRYFRKENYNCLQLVKFI